MGKRQSKRKCKEQQANNNVRRFKKAAIEKLALELIESQNNRKENGLGHKDGYGDFAATLKAAQAVMPWLTRAQVRSDGAMPSNEKELIELHDKKLKDRAPMTVREFLVSEGKEEFLVDRFLLQEDVNAVAAPKSTHLNELILPAQDEDDAVRLMTADL